MVLIMKYKCIVSYDGYSYSGYQKQKHDKNTIQEEIENVLSTIFKEKIVIHGSGRTDKSVHGAAVYPDARRAFPPRAPPRLIKRA